MIPDGVHFGLSEAVYRQDPALGYSDHKALLSSPVQFQWKRLAATRVALGFTVAPEDESTEQAFGTALDCYVFDGEAAFLERYALPGERPEGLIETKGDVREALGSACTLPPHALLFDFIQLAKREGLEDRLHETWLLTETMRKLGKREISRPWWASIRFINRLLDTPRESLGGASVRERILSGGEAQVSIFWTCPVTGVRCKARVDYLKVRVDVDLKTFGAREGYELVDEFTGKVRTYAYDMQTEHYGEGTRLIPQFLSEGSVFHHYLPDEPEPIPLALGQRVDRERALVAAIAAHQGPRKWTWLTVQTIGQPEVDVMEHDAPIVAGAAVQMVQKARREYAAYTERFGADQLWVADRGIIRLEDLTFPSTITSRGSEKWTSI